MFPWDNKPSDAPTPPNDYTVKFDGIQNQLETLNRMLAQSVLPQLSPKPKKFLNVTLNAAAITYDSLGYTNFGIIVGAAQTLTISLMGQNYNLSLNAGMNQLQLIDGSLLSSSTPFPCIFIWSDDILTNDNTAGTTTLTGSNFEGVPNTTAPAKVIAMGGKYSNGTIQPLTLMTNQDSTNFQTAQMLMTGSLGFAYNETYADRWRNNTQGTLLASAARTATASSSLQTNYNARGVIVWLRVSVASGTGGLQLKVQGQDQVTGQVLDLNVNPTAVTATGWYGYVIYPGASGGGGTNQYVTQSTSVPLPRTWGVAVLHGDASSYTYSVSHQLVL